MAARRVLVTGGAGYIGSHTVLQLLLGGFEVAVIDKLDNSSEVAIQRVSDLAGSFGRNLTFHQVVDDSSIRAKCQEWEMIAEAYKSERNKLRVEVKDLKGLVESLTRRGVDFQVDVTPEVAKLTRKLQEAENEWAFHLAQNKCSFAMYKEEQQMAIEYWKLFQRSRGFVGYALEKLVEADVSCRHRGFEVPMFSTYIEYLQREKAWEKEAAETQAPNRRPKAGGFEEPLPYLLWLLRSLLDLRFRS